MIVIFIGMNIRRIIKQTLNEVAGISFEVREWVNIISDEINRMIEDADDEINSNTSDDDELDNGWSYFSRWKPRKHVEINELTIHGQDHPEAYEKFSVDKWIFREANRMEYDHYQSGYSDNGEYIVYFNVPIRKLNKDVLVHEIKHAYDDWNRMRNGGKPIRDSWEIKNIYTKDFERLILSDAKNFNQIGPILRNYYMGSKLETPAYLETEYDYPSMMKYKGVARKLISFNKDTYYNKKGELSKGLEDEFNNLVTNYDIPLFRKFKSVDNFLDYTQNYFNKRGEDILKKINKTMYIHGKL